MRHFDHPKLGGFKLRLIRVELAHDRDRCGTLAVVDAEGRLITGPFPIAARTTDQLASSRNNRMRDPLRRFGNTPTGHFRIAPLTVDEDRYPAAEFGRHGLIPLMPTAGDAAFADANGRYGFAIFGGPPAADNSLRSVANLSV